MFNHILFDLDSTIYNYDISNCISYDKLIDELGHEFKINKEQLVKTYKREKKNIKIVVMEPLQVIINIYKLKKYLIHLI